MLHHPLQSHQRQVHLDFHTSPHIPHVAAEFDADEFANTFKRAHVNSVTVFAKCHHGQCYYPTKTGVQHPGLGGRDLLGEQIEALHRAGIRAPIYTTVAWEENVAARHPEWRQVTQDGHFVETAAIASVNHPGKWKFVNFLDPDYQDYIQAHLEEILARYDVDGIFFDILSFGTGACWSDASLRFREQHGLMGTDKATFERFQAAAQASFARRFTQLIHSKAPEATVFYNASNDQVVEAAAGPRMRMRFQTHAEIESLPSGIWGYHHFSRTARAIAYWGKPWLGQTGRFQKMWGDFGGYKPIPALEFECFRTQALGGGNSVGDQMHPRGILDAATYNLIGEVYRQCAEAEPFYEGSQPLPQIGIVSAHSPGAAADQTSKSEEGATLLADEFHYEAMFLDEESPLDGLDLVILPDSVVITPKLGEKLAEYHARGGKFLLSCDSGHDASGNWALPFIPITISGPIEAKPVYWRARSTFDSELALADRVIYEQGRKVQGDTGTQVWIDRVLPYFDRTDVHYCSHFQAPPRLEADSSPALLAGERWAYFADPIFREYRQSANQAVKQAWKTAMERLIGAPRVGCGLPGSILQTPRRRGTSLLLTLLRYTPVRKAIDVDVIDERGNFAGEILRVPPAIKRVLDFQDGSELPSSGDGCFLLPAKQGRLLLEIPGYFQQ